MIIQIIGMDKQPPAAPQHIGDHPPRTPQNVNQEKAALCTLPHKRLNPIDQLEVYYSFNVPFLPPCTQRIVKLEPVTQMSI